MLAATIGPSEERILAIERDRPDGALDDVGIDLDPAIIQEADEAVPAAEAIEPKPASWKPTSAEDKWPGRKEGSYKWYEIQDSVDYWEKLEQPKILYGDIAWSASFSIDSQGLFCNNTAYFLPTGDRWLVTILNAPIGWWYSWRRAQHAKDEALRYFNTFVEDYPVPIPPSAEVMNLVEEATRATSSIQTAHAVLMTWLHHEFGIDKPGRILDEPHRLDPDGFISAVRSSVSKSKKWSAAEIARLKAEYDATLTPARDAATDLLIAERRLSRLVNTAYGLSPDEVKLMWDTAPPRMPMNAEL